ncbi:MAG: hypothetical protein HZB29_00825 [Nitrospinae bacterium]|nr:hypothetical protein [Nitrospinota bacterium]
MDWFDQTVREWFLPFVKEWFVQIAAAILLFVAAAFIATARRRRVIFNEHLVLLGAPPLLGGGTFSPMKREWPYKGHRALYIVNSVEDEDDPNDTSITIFHQRPLNIGLRLSNLAGVQLQNVSAALKPVFSPIIKAATATYGHEAIPLSESLEKKFARAWATDSRSAAAILGSDNAVKAIDDMLAMLEPARAELKIDDNGVTMKLMPSVELGAIYLDKAVELSRAITSSINLPPEPPPKPWQDKVLRVAIYALLIATIVIVAISIIEGLGLL